MYVLRWVYVYKGTSLTGNRNPLGPCRRPMPRVLGGSYGVGRFLVGEVPLSSSDGMTCIFTPAIEYKQSNTYLHLDLFIGCTGVPR